ncbi:ribosomal L1 domain-containing protein CG13096-like isoform X2 [Chenopodium quinoa]|uniref:ribosomal L1 domain-containing protein CG13096-like isoform X2 n=1 Tax=Chenopodium quinoa TaxID=63459 RepID=UPI000B78FB43|nr:ribosomal L1 domain-containing protein CG13096-like isoform X2 [Chenopodium quinoa]
MKTNTKGSVMVPPMRVMGSSKAANNGASDGSKKKANYKGKKKVRVVSVFEQETLEDSCEQSAADDDVSNPDFYSNRKSDPDDDEEDDDDVDAEEQLESEDQIEEAQQEQSDLDNLLVKLLIEKIKNGKWKGVGKKAKVKAEKTKVEKVRAKGLW